jgi:hypothetical protein
MQTTKTTDGSVVADPYNPIGDIFIPMGCFLGFLMAFPAAGGVFIYQCYLWLRFGEWSPISVIGGIHVLKETKGVDLTWLLKPLADWQGILKILDSIPASLFLFFAGLAVLYLTTRLEQFEKRRSKEKAPKSA